MEPEARILVVDDDRVSRVLLRKHLDAAASIPLEIDESDSGEDALRLLQERRYDLVVADHLLPGITGLDLLEEVRRRDPGAMRVVMTAYGTMPIAIEAINRAGVGGYLEKPLRAADVARVVTDLLGRRKG